MALKAALNNFLRNPSNATYTQVKNELEMFNCMSSKNVVNSQLLIPLVLKLDALGNHSQDLRTYCLECITLILSKVFLVEITALRTLFVIILKQINKKLSKNAIEEESNISEELKLSSVQCLTISLKRSVSDVLEQFYIKENAAIIGQVLLILIDYIEREKYKALVRASLECIMTIFYIHDESDKNDVVFRKQVADTLFIFLPKIITVLHKIALGDDKICDDIKQICIKILGNLLHITFEDSYLIANNEMHGNHDAASFNALLQICVTQKEESRVETELKKFSNFGCYKEKLDELKYLHDTGRTQYWQQRFCSKLYHIFLRLTVLRSHTSLSIRQEYAAMFCLLINKCGFNLKYNFLTMLENVIALTEDDDPNIRRICQNCLKQLNLEQHLLKQLFEQNVELLFEEHITNFPRIICKCDSKTQYAEILFIQGFLKTLSPTKLISLLTIPQNIERLLKCILMAAKLSISSDLLNRSPNMHNTNQFTEYNFTTLPWRKFRNISCSRCIDHLINICQILGNIATVNTFIFDYLIELYDQIEQKFDVTVNKSEIILVALWLSTSPNSNNLEENLVSRLLELLLKDENWFLLIEPTNFSRLKCNKPVKWIIDDTSGCYESAMQICVQDVHDSDDDINEEATFKVSSIEAQVNVLHTCIILDALGHCALYLNTQYDVYVFRSLHKIVLKLADSNVMIHQAAYYALSCLQKALNYSSYENIIEEHMDYIEYYLENMLKKNVNIESAINTLSIVTKFCSRFSISYFEHILQVIYEQCIKLNQLHYITSYIRLFNRFLEAFTIWTQSCYDFDSKNIPLVLLKKKEYLNIATILSNWLKELTVTPSDEYVNENCAPEHSDNVNIISNIAVNTHSINASNNGDEISKDIVPRHIVLIKEILYQLVKLLWSKDTMHTILGLESLICGLPLLKHYDTIFYPLVHNMWKPFVKKFEQNDIVVLNRCFKLLLCLSSTATDFITKRCLDDVIPFLKDFLKRGATDAGFWFNRKSNFINTKESKLQVELLEELPTLIINLDIDGKNLSDITKIIVLYLNNAYPSQLQHAAMLYFTHLLNYNGPMIYSILLQKTHTTEYRNNCENLLNEFIKY